MNDTPLYYDRIGNPITYFGGFGLFTLTWENGRQLASAYVNSQNIYYEYNDEGIRTSKTVDGVKHEYYLNGSQIVAECIGNKRIIYIYDADGSPIGMQYRENAFAEGVFYTFWFEKNLQGDIVAIYNNQGTKVLKYTYDAWGNVTTTYYSAVPADVVADYNCLKYRGYYYDSDIGFYYLNSRYYDPNTGRFINSDSQLFTGNDILGTNLFAYCGNNPVNRIDPNGEAWWHWAIGATIVVACAVATVATCGGFAAAAGAVAAVGSGVAAATTASTIAAGAFIGSATVYGAAVIAAASTSNSVEEFNDKGNWSTVAHTAFAAVIAGSGAYFSTKDSASSLSVTKAETTTIKNDVVGLPRTGSALKTDSFHAFSDIVDNYAGYATKYPISNGTLYQPQGSLNGIEGRFEWIIQNQQVTHRMFVSGGGINGIPIMP